MGFKLKAVAVATVAVFGLSTSVLPAAAAAIGSASNATPTSAGVTAQGQQYLDSMSPTQRQQFVTTELVSAVTVSYSSVTPADAQARAAVAEYGSAAAAVTEAASGCWLGRANYKATALAGNTLYTYFHTGGWCISGGTVYDPSTYEDGGETSTPGWHYDGVIARNAGVISNQGRSYSQFKFTLSAGPWDIQTPTPCIRVNGLSNATFTSSGTCGIS